jgi:hypothetical protein
MPKATHTNTIPTPAPAPDVAPAKRTPRGTRAPHVPRPAVQAPEAKPVAAPPSDAIVRMLCMASETAEVCYWLRVH